MTVREKSHRLFFALHILIPLLIGTAIYLWLRPDLDLSRLLTNIAGQFTTMPTIGPATSALTPTFPSILPGAATLIRTLRNFGSDILWAYALTATLMWILGTCRRSAILSAGIAAALGAGLEAAQLVNLLGGTFDPLDILLETAAALAAASIIHLVLHGGEYEKLRQSPKHRPGPRLVHGHRRRFVIQIQGDAGDQDQC